MNKILVIDDEPEMRNTLRDILETENFQTFLATNGQQGVAAARSESPDLILCDVTMPGMDGHEVLKALRADTMTARIPFIFLTAMGERKDMRTGMNLGADDYLIKAYEGERFAGSYFWSRGLSGAQQRTGFKADFSSSSPLTRLGVCCDARPTFCCGWQGQNEF